MDEELIEECKEEDRRKKMWGNIIYYTVLIAIVFISLFVLRLNIVKGNSMEPSLHNGELIIGLNKKTSFGIKRGDVVVIDISDRNLDIDNNPEERDYIVKRTIGIPGDRIKISMGDVFVNGTKIKEEYVAPNVKTGLDYSDNSEWVLGDNEYFVLGDNRFYMASMDSRSIGKINGNDIKYKLKLILFPFDKFGVKPFKTDTFSEITSIK